MEQDIILVIDPGDQPEDLHFPYPADQLPDLPSVEADQVPNNNPQQNQPIPQQNPPNQQIDPPTEQPDQPQNPPANHPNQPNQTNPPPNQPPNLPANPPDPMANPQQLNWSYFKPEFAGKPEGDAEAHLLRTNDWMETHDFTDDRKERRFCLTLMGEARLWYETLRAGQLDWAALQEHFWQQYSKFGSTREQYFHVWRLFHYDENTDTIDSYIGRVKQVAALLNYGEPQILELFKNTLASRLYYMLYHIDDLRTAMETAKRVLTKEKIDQQRTGQSSTSPFMKASQEKSKKNCEKGVSFVALETIERNSDSIDKLSSLVSKLDMKLDRRENQYRPRILSS